MFTKVKIGEFQTYWPISKLQADNHQSFQPFSYRTYYLRVLPRYGALSRGWFYDYLCRLQYGGSLSLHEVSHCGDCWVFIFDDLSKSDIDGICDSGVGVLLAELKDRLRAYGGLPLPDLELVHPVNKFVLFSLGVFSGDWQYNKLIEWEV